MGRSQKVDARKPLSVKVSEETYAEMVQLCEVHGFSITGLVRAAIKAAIGRLQGAEPVLQHLREEK